MQVIGESLYMSYRDIRAYDIANPEQPVQTWKGYTGGEVVRDFCLVGDQIYYFGWTILSEYVRGTISLPEPIVGSPMGLVASVTAMHNGDFIVAYNGLEIYATANPQDLQLVGSYQAAVTNAIGAVVNERAVFVVDDGVGDGLSNAVLRVFSLPDLTSLGQVTSEFLTGWSHGFRGISLDNDRVYLVSEDAVWVYDVRSSEPTLLSRQEISGGQVESIAAIKLAEKRLLATSQEVEHLSVLSVYDLTDLEKPFKLGNSPTIDKGTIIQMTWNGSYLYTLLDTSYHSDSDLLYVFDFDNNALRLRESLQLTKYIDNMAVDKKHLALTGPDDLLTRSFLIGVQPEPLKLLSQTTLPEAGMGVTIIKDKALVVVGDEYGAAQLLTFDIQDPSNPRQVGAMDIAISENFRVPILVSEPYVVLANGFGGVGAILTDFSEQASRP